MGASASVSEDVQLDEEVDPSSWLSLHIVSDNGVRFNSRTLYICDIADGSVLERKESRIHHKGYWWEHDHVPTEKDDEDNLNQVIPMSIGKYEEIKHIANRAGLNISYSEHFACPKRIRNDSIFVAVRFVYRPNANKNPSITSLSGCISKEELNVPFDNVYDKATRGAWIQRAKDLLPGPRFESVHVEIKDWWDKVEKLCEEVSNTEELAMRRAEFFSLSTKRSQAYSHAVQYGLGSKKSDEHMAMVETWKGECEKSLVKVSHALLDKLFDGGKILLADVVKDRADAFEKLDALKELLHDEFMQSLLALGDQIESHEHDAWANFHLRFNSERRESTSVVPRRGRKASVMNIKQALSMYTVDKKKSKRVVVVSDALLGSSKQFADKAEARISPMTKLNSELKMGADSQTSPFIKKKKLEKSSSRMSLAPLEEEDRTEKKIEDKVKNMIMNMTASATQNATRAKLTKRLSLVKAQKTRQRNEAFVIGAIAHFECLLFDLCINAKMLDYMDRERAILENKIFNQISTVKKAQSIKHSKDLGQAIKNNCDDKTILALEVDLQKRKDKLHNRLNHRKERKRKEFDEAKALTLERLKEKLEDINQESTTASLTATATSKLKAISVMYKMLQQME